MILLIAGLALFAGIHLLPSLAPGLKRRGLDRLGEGGYKGGFSLLVVAAFVLMVFGWRSAVPVPVYQPPAVLHMPALGLLVVAFALLVTSTRPSRLRLLVRHPQLTGVCLWGIAHLLLNGDNRSLVLFAGMSCWALVEMVAINRRDGLWIKDAAPAWGSDVLNLVITAVVIAVVILLHPWLGGVPVAGMLAR